MDFLFSPDLFIFGGGVSKKFEKYGEYLTVKTEIVPAQLLNDAGIIGAAMAAYERFPPQSESKTNKHSPLKRAADTQKTVV